MKKAYGLFVVLFISCGLILPFLSPSKTLAASVSLTPTADTYVSSASKNATPGDIDHFFVYSNPNAVPESIIEFGLLRFDLSGIPNDAVISSAVLTVYKYQFQGNDATIFTRRITGEWTEANTSWNNRPSYDLEGPSSNVGINAESASFNVFDFVNNWLSGTTNYGVYLATSGNQNFSRAFNSRENTNNKPKLVIDYAIPTPATPTPEPLLPPTNLKAEVDQSDCHSINLSWTKSTNANLGGYNVYLSEENEENFAIITKLKPDVEKYEFKDTHDGKTYYFKLNSYRGNSTSGFSDIVQTHISCAKAGPMVTIFDLGRIWWAYAALAYAGAAVIGVWLWWAKTNRKWPFQKKKLKKTPPKSTDKE